uniref:GSVIVT00025647001 n=1 Tax=Arundo donax TaxID=35708 RepID=A0A0A8ZE33_ARUDO
MLRGGPIDHPSWAVPNPYLHLLSEMAIGVLQESSKDTAPRAGTNTNDLEQFTVGLAKQPAELVQPLLSAVGTVHRSIHVPAPNHLSCHRSESSTPGMAQLTGVCSLRQLIEHPECMAFSPALLASLNNSATHEIASNAAQQPRI